MRHKRNTFTGSIGFVLAAAGSAVGLGNIWRFPYLAARDGGGLFLCIYIILALTFGFTLLITEVAIGRRSHQGPLTAYRFFNKKWGFIGYFSFIVPYIIYPYYCVIGGWVLKYLATYTFLDSHEVVHSRYFTNFITDTQLPFVYMAAFALLSFYIVYCGVEKGIERTSRIIMPLLIFMIMGICIYSLTLSHTAPDGTVRTGLQGALIYFIPNFHGLTLDRFFSITLDATGQLFYSLSIAMGIMVTYGSYMKRNVNLGKAVDQIEVCDTLIAVLAGLMIIPAVYVFMGTEGMGAGPGLMFVALPKVFASVGYFGPLLGFVFFVTVMFAALTSSVSILEAIVASMMDKFHWRRRKAVIIMGLNGFFWSLIVCMGYNYIYFEYTLPNGVTGQILDIFDYISNNVLMPLVAICTCLLIGWVTGPRLLVGEIRLNGYKFRRKQMYIIMLKYIVPLLLSILLLSVIGLF